MIFSTKFNVKIEYIVFFRVRVLTNFLKVKKMQFLASKEISWQRTCRFHHMILILWVSIFSQSIVSFNIFFHRILNGTLKSKKECNMYLLHTKCTMKKQFNDGPKSVPKKIKKTNYLNVLLRFRSQNLVKNFYCCSWGFSKDIFYNVYITIKR